MRKYLLFLTFFAALYAQNVITIYNNDFAYVKENVTFNLKKGTQSLNFSDFANSIVIDSLYFQFSNDIKLLSYEIIFKNSNLYGDILKNNLNENVDFFYEDKKYSGKLVSVTPIIVKSKERYFILKDASKIIFKTLPKIINKDFIRLKIDSKKDKKESVKLYYLINSISWSMSYIANLNKNSLNLIGFAKIKNNSGRDFKDFKINLVAGSVNKSYKKRVYSKNIAFAAAPVQEEGVIPKSFSGLYKYEVSNKDSLLSNTLKEVLLINKNFKFKSYAVAINRNFNNYGNKDIFFKRAIEFKNDSNLPLPSGVVRAYKNDTFLGEDNILNISKNQSVTLNLGKYFDIKGKKSIVKYITRKNYKNVKTKYTLTNGSKKEVVVKLQEQIPRYKSKITFKSDCKGCVIKDKNAFYKEFIIKLKPNSNFSFTTEFEVFYE